MQAYEYKVILFKNVPLFVRADLRTDEGGSQASREHFEDWLNHYGEEGWELVNRGDLCYIFKRKK